jgi:hypothetical protein
MKAMKTQMKTDYQKAWHLWRLLALKEYLFNEHPTHHADFDLYRTFQRFERLPVSAKSAAIVSYNMRQKAFK